MAASPLGIALLGKQDRHAGLVAQVVTKPTYQTHFAFHQAILLQIVIEFVLQQLGALPLLLPAVEAVESHEKQDVHRCREDGGAHHPREKPQRRLPIRHGNRYAQGQQKQLNDDEPSEGEDAAIGVKMAHPTIGEIEKHQGDKHDRNTHRLGKKRQIPIAQPSPVCKAQRSFQQAPKNDGNAIGNEQNSQQTRHHHAAAQQAVASEQHHGRPHGYRAHHDTQGSHEDKRRAGRRQNQGQRRNPEDFFPPDVQIKGGRIDDQAGGNEKQGVVKEIESEFHRNFPQSRSRATGGRAGARQKPPAIRDGASVRQARWCPNAFRPHQSASRLYGPC